MRNRLEEISLAPDAHAMVILTKRLAHHAQRSQEAHYGVAVARRHVADQTLLPREAENMKTH